MANPPRKKGTGFETETVNEAKEYGLDAFRLEQGSPYDIEVRGSTGRVIEALVTRPDRGESLATIRTKDLLHILAEHGDNAHIECKRYARFALHTIFEYKFGRKK